MAVPIAAVKTDSRDCPAGRLAADCALECVVEVAAKRRHRRPARGRGRRTTSATFRRRMPSRRGRARRRRGGRCRPGPRRCDTRKAPRRPRPAPARSRPSGTKCHPRASNRGVGRVFGVVVAVRRVVDAAQPSARLDRAASSSHVVPARRSSHRLPPVRTHRSSAVRLVGELRRRKPANSAAGMITTSTVL